MRRRNPRPIPLDRTETDRITDTLLDLVYDLFQPYRRKHSLNNLSLLELALSYSASPQMNDDGLPILVYGRGKRQVELPVIPFDGLGYRIENDLVTVKGKSFGDLEVYFLLNERQDSDLPFPEAAWSKGEERLVIEFNMNLTPKDYLHYFDEKEHILRYFLNHIVVHELTHALDMSDTNFEGFRDGRVSFEDDRNSPRELRARLRDIITDLELIAEDPQDLQDWVDKNLDHRYLHDAIQDVSFHYRMNYDVYTDDSHVYLMSGVYQWLIENGYTIPRRRL